MNKIIFVAIAMCIIASVSSKPSAVGNYGGSYTNAYNAGYGYSPAQVAYVSPDSSAYYSAGPVYGTNIYGRLNSGYGYDSGYGYNNPGYISGYNVPSLYESTYYPVYGPGYNSYPSGYMAPAKAVASAAVAPAPPKSAY